MTRGLASQPRPASLEAAWQLPRIESRPPRRPSPSCSAASSPSALTEDARRARQAVLRSERLRSAPWQSSNGLRHQAGEAVVARSWRRRDSNGTSKGGAQHPAERSRQRAELPQQGRWSPAVAVAADPGLIERATDATPAPSPAEGSASPAGSSSISSSSNETARSGNGAGPPTGDVLIELHDVSKAFGKKAILQGTTLKIRRGEAVGIIGGSGTGKSTTLRLMAGLLEPDSGQVVVQGVPRKGLLTDDDAGAGLHIGMVFQSGALFDSLTVGENVGFLLYEHSDLPRDRIQRLVARALSQVGLSGVENLYPAELSGGMKKRVALARAIIRDDENDTSEQVVMYDEPTAGLDPVASTVVEDLIRSLHVGADGGNTAAGGISAYIVVTHQHSTIRRAVDRLVFLHEGKVVWEGSTDEFESSELPIVKQFRTGGLKGPIKYV